MTSDKSKLTQSVVISKESEFINKVQIPAEAPSLRIVRLNGYKEAVRTISSVTLIKKALYTVREDMVSLSGCQMKVQIIFILTTVVIQFA